MREQHVAAGDDGLHVRELLALERLAQVGHRQPVAADVDRTEQGDVAGHQSSNTQSGKNAMTIIGSAQPRTSKPTQPVAVIATSAFSERRFIVSSSGSSLTAPVRAPRSRTLRDCRPA